MRMGDKVPRFDTSIWFHWQLDASQVPFKSLLLAVGEDIEGYLHKVKDFCGFGIVRADFVWVVFASGFAVGGAQFGI